MMIQVPPFHTLQAPCDFYFVRHGESEANAGGRIQGHHDSPLSAVGRGHAAAAGEWFADRGIDAMVSSPLARARETAGVIAERLGLRAPETLAELIELNTGQYSGLTMDEVRTRDPGLYARFRVRSWEAVPQAESIASLQRRAGAAWTRLIELAARGHRRIVAVTHGGTIQWLIKATIGAPQQPWMPIFKASNCGIFLLRAESTVPADGRPPDPGTGYYGIWELMNYLPY